ncbi:MAG: translational machinery protein [Bauldia sp.]
MTSHNHAVVWIDHKEARVFHFDRAGSDKISIQPDAPTRHIHHKANSIGSGHASADEAFLHEVAHAVADVEKILITGPSSAKTELVKHIHRHDPRLIEHIAGVETVDHPSDKELVAHARKYFSLDGEMLGRSS